MRRKRLSLSGPKTRWKRKDLEPVRKAMPDGADKWLQENDPKFRHHGRPRMETAANLTEYRHHKYGGNPMTSAEKIKLILEWADDGNDWFNTEFVEKMRANLDAFGSLSEAQLGALDNIIRKCKITI